jgi:hypothetical protein
MGETVPRPVAFTNLSRTSKMELPQNAEERPRTTMPLSGEAIRLMNYVDDVTVTLRRVLALAPTLTDDERSRVSEYLKASRPNADTVLEALNSKGC